MPAPAPGVAAVPPAALPPSLRSALRDINFQFDQYALTDDAKATLDELGQALKANPQFLVTIEGHADERGTVEYNLALALLALLLAVFGAGRISVDGLFRRRRPELAEDDDGLP